MLQKIKITFKYFDYTQLLTLMVLMVVSFFAVYSASYDLTTGKVQEYPFTQLRVFGIGLCCYVVISFIGYKKFVKYAPAFFVVSCAVLVAVLVMGKVGMGAQRWLQIGPVKGQPSELFKWVFILMLAWGFTDLKASSMGFFKLALKAFWVIPPFVLVFLQPDLGTAMTYLAVWGLVVLFLGVKRYIIIASVIILVILTPIMWGQLKDYQKLRVTTFLNPESDPGGAGYQAIQSKIAIGSGGLTGKGYLKGTQSHLRFMPERHTDFIFSVICEEFGFVGGGFIIFLFFMVILRILALGVQINDANGKIICIASACLIFFQFYVNVSMTLGIAPVVGVPLPFISYGGSSLLTFICIMGLINSVHIEANIDHSELTKKKAALFNY